MPNNYSRGKIYKIVCRKTGLQYFGSTTEPTLARRLAGHVSNFKRWKKGNCGFTTSFIILEENDYYIELVELVPCSCNDELLVRERFHIQNNECVNKNLSNRTSKEWRDENKEQIAEKAKIYYDKHKEQIAETQKIYREEHKEELKKYYEATKEQIAEKKKEKIKCECGSTIRKYDKAIHEKSKKHHKNIMEKFVGILDKICCVIENGENIQVK